MIGCCPDSLKGCIPGMAIGCVRAEMPNPLLPQFPLTAVSPVGEQQFWHSYVTRVGCKELAGLEGEIMMDGEKEKRKEAVLETKLSTVTDLSKASF